MLNIFFDWMFKGEINFSFIDTIVCIGELIVIYCVVFFTVETIKYIKEKKKNKKHLK